MIVRSSLLEVCCELSIIEKVEICGLLGGAKSIVRICRKIGDVGKLSTAVERLNLSLLRSGVTFIKGYETSSGQTYGFAVPSGSRANGLTVLYVTRLGDEHLARELSQLEVQGGANVAIGDWLGIPRCCCAQYAKIGRSFNWIDVMLEATNMERDCFGACNQFAREYLGVVLKPDYFPCSFQCEETRRIGLLYRELVDEYVGPSFRKDLELICNRPVEIGYKSSLMASGINTIIPIGSTKFAGSRLVFA